MMPLIHNELPVSGSYQVRHHDLIPGCEEATVLAIINGLWHVVAHEGGYVSGRLTANTAHV
jgi:hypothetical protein